MRELTEHEEQRNFVSWFKKTFHEWIYAIPNGGARDIITASRMKVEGVSPGVPDLCIPSWRLYIEMKKVQGGTVSNQQKGWIKHLSETGYTALIANGCDQAKAQIEEYYRNGRHR